MMSSRLSFYFWLSFRLLKGKTSQLFSLSGLNALVGLILGVACLVVSMAVMSGFESTLQKSVADVSGHVQLLVRRQSMYSSDQYQQVLDKIKKIEPSFVAATRFSYLEAVLAHQGKISGVMLQGLDPQSVGQALGLQSRLAQGQLDFGSQDDAAGALIGSGLSSQMGLKVGDRFRLVLPMKNEYQPQQFRRKVGSFIVRGILDLGKYEYNQRLILTSLSKTQELAEIGDRYSGVLLKFDDINRAREIADHLRKEIGEDFSLRDWREINENLFEAVKIERPVVFFVILIIIVAAAFNVASTLYINVVSRYAEIGLLKSLGLSRKDLLRVFSLQGVMMGLVGLLGGLFVGALLCVLVTYVQTHFGFLPGSVYKIDHIDLSLRWQDLLVISLVTVLICFVATLAPAVRGASLSPVEGLKNE